MPISSFLDQNPQAAYVRMLQGQPPQMARFMAGQFNNIYNRYLGELPNDPTLDFSTWLTKLNIPQEYQGFSPRQRGSFPSQLAPATRFLNY